MCGGRGCRDDSHRKAWVHERLEFLSSIFAIDIATYALMSNHYHLVLHVDQDRILGCSEGEIVARWSRLFRISFIVQRWRYRLIVVSWFMRCLNEYLARRANAEDHCTGRFWEGRFKSQALFDETGLLTAMAYVDLNPLRIGMAATPEESEFTSVYARIQAMGLSQGATKTAECFKASRLLAFRDQAQANAPAIPMRFRDYLELLDWSGRIVRSGKRGAIDDWTPPIHERLNVDPRVWQDAMRIRGNVFGRALGKLDRLRPQALGQSRIKGLTRAQRLFRAA